MIQIDTKPIILFAPTMVVTILILTLPSLSTDGFSQTLQMPEFQSNFSTDKSEINDNTQPDKLCPPSFVLDCKKSANINITLIQFL